MAATRSEPDAALAEGLDQGRVRRMNTAVVLRALAAAGEASLAELGRSTGLSRRTLQAILDELRRAGWALESETASGGAGRPAKSYTYVADHRVAVALRLDTHTAYAMIVDLHGRGFVPAPDSGVCRSESAADGAAQVIGQSVPNRAGGAPGVRVQVWAQTAPPDSASVRMVRNLNSV